MRRGNLSLNRGTTLPPRFGAPRGWTWDVAYLDTDSINGFDTVRLTAAPVPVPPSVWLLGSGLVGLFGIRRRFSSKQK